ncbi:hypothetical protein T4B_4139 [Trichinella pseudospiralis]|uniref:Uncharacterized protein n=1 Tax=Trichinella pseudospiralis TaxID=6337 RepID=A0A0V1IP15_TRIPS|nr:hypothetical protein T4B_4139 [Trichinella pseudospiralis]
MELGYLKSRSNCATVVTSIWSELESNQRPMDIRPLNNDESGRTLTPFEAGCRQGETELRDGTVLLAVRRSSARRWDR